MPLYEYKCSKCKTVFEVMQKVTEPPLTTCIKCGGKVTKIISAPAIQFKGNGWYITDYANKKTAEDQHQPQDTEKKETKTAPPPKKEEKPSSSTSE